MILTLGYHSFTPKFIYLTRFLPSSAHLFPLLSTDFKCQMMSARDLECPRLRHTPCALCTNSLFSRSVQRAWRPGAKWQVQRLGLLGPSSPPAPIQFVLTLPPTHPAPPLHWHAPWTLNQGGIRPHDFKCLFPQKSKIWSTWKKNEWNQKKSGPPKMNE